METRPFKVIVAEDEPIILHNIIEKIEKASHLFEVVGSSTNGEDALSLIEQRRPDVLFTDIRMPLMDGLELIREVKNRFPEIHTVVISGFDDFSFARQALKYGVADYLLKPVQPALLRDCLNEIRIKLERRHEVAERNIIAQDIHGLLASDDIPSSLKQSRFALYLICIGNLYKYAPSTLETRDFVKLWEQVRWTNVLSASRPTAQKYWLIDERYRNMKMLIIASEPERTEELPLGAERLRQDISVAIGEAMPVTVCCTDHSVDLDGLWETSCGLRKAMDKKLAVCRSSTIVLKDAETDAPTPDYLDPAIISALDTFVKQKRFDLLHLELTRIFENWKLSMQTQKLLEKALLRLSGFLFECMELGNLALLLSVEAELYALVADASDLDSLFEEALRAIERHMPRDPAIESTRELFLKLERYIRSHFTEPINVKLLAETFQFNSSYIIRVFKKYKGMPPLQYLISLRIDEAKRLIETNPDLDFKSVSEIVGYADQHYFSRVFKNMTGMNPSEYREAVHKKES